MWMDAKLFDSRFIAPSWLTKLVKSHMYHSWFTRLFDFRFIGPVWLTAFLSHRLIPVF